MRKHEISCIPCIFSDVKVHSFESLIRSMEIVSELENGHLFMELRFENSHRSTSEISNPEDITSVFSRNFKSRLSRNEMMSYG